MAPLRVLVVDDDFMVARIHARFVEATAGFVVAGTARTGAEALALADELAPDVVLLDVHLPDLSGLEVLERLRASGSGAAVVMVTAERGAEAVRAARHGGALQYLVKPFEQADLAERLHGVAATLQHLAGSAAPTIDQAAIDEVFGRPSAPATGSASSASTASAPLPKGLSRETADLVLSRARDVDEISATQAAEAIGLSRVTARRYLEHFVDAGALEVRLQYGGTGRPERRYRTPR